MKTLLLFFLGIAIGSLGSFVYLQNDINSNRNTVMELSDIGKHQTHSSIATNTTVHKKQNIEHGIENQQEDAIICMKNNSKIIPMEKIIAASRAKISYRLFFLGDSVLRNVFSTLYERLSPLSAKTETNNDAPGYGFLFYKNGCNPRYYRLSCSFKIETDTMKIEFIFIWIQYFDYPTPKDLATGEGRQFQHACMGQKSLESCFKHLFVDSSPSNTTKDFLFTRVGLQYLLFNNEVPVLNPHLNDWEKAYRKDINGFLDQAHLYFKGKIIIWGMLAVGADSPSCRVPYKNVAKLMPRAMKALEEEIYKSKNFKENNYHYIPGTYSLKHAANVNSIKSYFDCWHFVKDSLLMDQTIALFLNAIYSD